MRKQQHQRQAWSVMPENLIGLARPVGEPLQSQKRGSSDTHSPGSKMQLWRRGWGWGRGKYCTAESAKMLRAKKKKKAFVSEVHCTCQCPDQAKPAWLLVWQSRLVSLGFTLRLCRYMFLFLSSFLCVRLWVFLCYLFSILSFSFSLWVSLTFSLHVSLSQINS